jgi:hypothetical protein
MKVAANHNSKGSDRATPELNFGTIAAVQASFSPT